MMRLPDDRARMARDSFPSPCSDGMHYISLPARSASDERRPRPPCGGGTGWGVSRTSQFRGWKGPKRRVQRNPPPRSSPTRGRRRTAPTSFVRAPETCACRRALAGNGGPQGRMGCGRLLRCASDCTIGAYGNARASPQIGGRGDLLSTPHSAPRATFPGRAGAGAPRMTPADVPTAGARCWRFDPASRGGDPRSFALGGRWPSGSRSVRRSRWRSRSPSRSSLALRPAACLPVAGCRRRSASRCAPTGSRRSCW